MKYPKTEPVKIMPPVEEKPVTLTAEDAYTISKNLSVKSDIEKICNLILSVAENGKRKALINMKDKDRKALGEELRELGYQVLTSRDYKDCVEVSW